jgi:integrase/recombinase XerD
MKSSRISTRRSHDFNRCENCSRKLRDQLAASPHENPVGQRKYQVVSAGLARRRVNELPMHSGNVGRLRRLRNKSKGSMQYLPTPSVAQRHQSATLFREREGFLCHLARNGANSADLKSTETYMFHIAAVLRVDPPRTVELAEIAKAARYWGTYRSGCTLKAERTDASRRFFRVARDWLRFEGLFSGSVPDHAYDWTAEYRGATKSSGRLASVTVEGYAYRVATFLKWFFDREGSRPFIFLKDLDDFIQSRGIEGRKRCTIASDCRALRSFLKYAETQGWCEASLSDQVKSPRASKFDVRKKGPFWVEVRKLLRSAAKGSTPVELRANAILHLLAIYGLRSSEVSRLKLIDFDWRYETFTVQRSKRGGMQRYPIQFEVGEAILKYLKYGRPKTNYPEVFVTAHVPHRALSAGPVWRSVGPRMRHLGIKSAHIGPHCLRHACAMRLLNKGLSMKEIADFLGHRDTATIAIYVRHDTRFLKQVAAFNLAGVYLP